MNQIWHKNSGAKAPFAKKRRGNWEKTTEFGPKIENFGSFGKMSEKGVVSAVFSFRKVGIPIMQ